jgi:hypothetical protein
LNWTLPDLKAAIPEQRTSSPREGFAAANERLAGEEETTRHYSTAAVAICQLSHAINTGQLSEY